MLLALLLALAPADSILLRVLTINDFHGALEPRIYGWSGGRQVGGIAALKATMDSLASRCRCPVLRLDAGDEMQGTLASNLTQGRASVMAMNRLGLAAAAVGNHEFDWGVPTLAARIKEAAYPWLVANVFDSVTHARPEWARPFATVTAGPYRIGVVGYVTPTTKHIVMAKQVAGLEFKGGRELIRETVAEARASNPDFTMIVVHEGAFCDSVACRGEVVNLAQSLDSTAVQLIVAGHTHTRIVTRVNGIPIVSAQANGALVGVADLVASGSGREWRIRVDTVWVDRVTPDSVAAAILDRDRGTVDRLAKRVIAELGDSLLTRGDEYPLGGLIADAQRAATGSDFAVMNRGGIRRELYPGPITYGQLFELHPFGNTLVEVAITGRDLERLMERSLAGFRPDLFPSGFTVKYDLRRPPGRRVVELRTTAGVAIDPERTYTLGVTDFLAGGGGGYSVLRELAAKPAGAVDLDALIAWLEAQSQPIRVPFTRRLIPVTP